jgi:hypothetical protein
VQPVPQAAGTSQVAQMLVGQYSPVSQSFSSLHPQWIGSPGMQALSESGPQVLPQEPQSLVVFRTVSQPSVQPPLQLPKPKSQLQVPVSHWAFWPQEKPQLPQLLSSVLVFTSQPLPQLPSQFCQGLVQLQVLEEQVAFAPQEFPQLPQLSGSVRMSISQPSFQLLSQLR